MIISKIHLSQKLIEGYVKTPPSLYDQAFTKLAIQLCQSFRLRRDIICASSTLTEEASRQNSNCYEEWEKLIEMRSKYLCKAISLPPAFKSELITRMRFIALEIFSWNKQHKEIFGTPAYKINRFLTPSDWTVEGRLDEGKIAERLVRNEKIPVCRRYLLACMHSLEPYILPLWEQSTRNQRNMFCGDRNLGYKHSWLVKLKSYHLAGQLNLLIGVDTLFCRLQLKEAMEEGSRTAFVNIWKTLSEDKKQNVIIPLAAIALIKNMQLTQKQWMTIMMQNPPYILLSGPAHFTDILYFLCSHMSEEQIVSFFRQIIERFKRPIHLFRFRTQHSDDPVFTCFLQWPYQDFFIPIITKLWGILPEDRYAQQLLMLAYRYARHLEGELRYQDYVYGHLLVELLEQTPAHYKRYVFSTTIPDLGSTWGAKVLLELIEKQPPYEWKDQRVFQRFLRQATPEEKQSVIYSESGERLCSRLIFKESLELLECILNECLTKEHIACFKRKFFLSREGNDLYCWLLKQTSENSANLFLKWGCLSQDEISAFKSELFFSNLGTFSMLPGKLELDQLDRLMSRCLPSQAARQQFKEELIEEIGMNVCARFIMRLKWKELKQFLDWSFRSEEANERYKQSFFLKPGVRIHSSLILNQQWKDAENCFVWCRLSPMAIKQLKKDIFSSSQFLLDLCRLLCKTDRLEDIARCLISWNLLDQKSVIACDESSNKFKPVDFYSYGDDCQQLIEENWKKLITQILCEKW